MSVGSGDPVEIYRARDLPEAHALRVALERAGIPAHLDNEMLQDASGVLLAGLAAALRVLVGPTDEAAARAVLEEFLRRAGGPEEGEDTPLRCLACGAAMGQANTCPACGWSYSLEPDAPPDPDRDAPPAEPAAAEDEIGAGGPGREVPPPPALARHLIWGEVSAVLAVAFVPSLVFAVDPLPPPPPPYWFDALSLTVRHGCTVFVTLYLIHRSGEPWERFGLTRPRLWDVLLGVGFFFVAEALWLFCCSRLPWDGGPSPGDLFPRPRRPEDYALMVLKFGANGFAEELVYRAYLITRLELLLRSRGAAVLLSGALFGAYHGYQGAAGVADTMAFGVAYGVAFLLLRRVWPLAVGHALFNIRIDLAA